MAPAWRSSAAAGEGAWMRRSHCEPASAPSAAESRRSPAARGEGEVVGALSATPRHSFRLSRFLEPGGVEERRELDIQLEGQPSLLRAGELDRVHDEEALRALQLGDEAPQVRVVAFERNADAELLEAVLVVLLVLVADDTRTDPAVVGDVDDLALHRHEPLLLGAEDLAVEVVDVLLVALQPLVVVGERLVGLLGLAQLHLEMSARALEVLERADARTDEERVGGDVRDQQRDTDQNEGLQILADVYGPHWSSPGSGSFGTLTGIVGTSGFGGAGGRTPCDPGGSPRPRCTGGWPVAPVAPR